MENKKGSGVFLGIVSIATLIVAIIGATFAYFSASTESNEGAIGLQAYEYKLSLSVSPVYPEGASALIPLNPTTVIENAPEPNNTNLLYAINVANKRCIDDSGMQVCALYEVLIQNDATNEVVMAGQLETTSNMASTKPGRTPFSNLTYQEITGEKDSFTLVGSPVTLSAAIGEAVNIGDIKVSGGYTDPETNKFVPGTGRAYILVYLNDNGNQTGEMGASFEGKLKYSSKDGAGTTLTGTFKVAAPDPEQQG